MKIAGTLFYGYLFVLMGLCINMGESKQTNSLSTVGYQQLKEKEGCFHATIIDDGNKIDVRNFSFTGYSSLGGVLKESDDSVNRLELSQLKEIKIVNRSYESERYKNQDLLKAEITTKNGNVIADLLIPRKVEISGIEISTQIQKAWSLSKVERIIIKGPCDPVADLEQKVNVDKKVEPSESKSESKKKKLSPTPSPTRRKRTDDIQEVAPLVQEPEKVIKQTTFIQDEPTQAPKPEVTVWTSFANLFDAIISVFKAIISAIAGLFGLR